LFLIVVVDGLSDRRVLSTEYLAANLVSGIIATPLIYWIARALGNGFKGTSFMKGLLEDMGG
jgi:hypothetical protein